MSRGSGRSYSSAPQGKPASLRLGDGAAKDVAVRLVLLVNSECKSEAVVVPYADTLEATPRVHALL